MTLTLSLFPLLSFAQNQFLSTGPTCRPEVLTSVTDFPNSKAQCPWCPDRGATKLRLSWDLPTEQTNPLCVITCRRPSGGNCQGASSRGNDGLATSTNDVNLMNLGKKGELTLAGDIREGNEYTVSCCEKCPPGARPGECNLLCKNEPASVVSFPAQVVGECRQTCERPFEDIKSKLSSFMYTVITERGGRDWINSYDSTDSCNSVPFESSSSCQGSGDRSDLEAWLEETYRDPIPAPPSTISNNDLLRTLSYLKASIKNGYPVLLRLKEFTYSGGRQIPNDLGGVETIIAYGFRMMQSAENGTFFEIDFYSDRGTESYATASGGIFSGLNIVWRDRPLDSFRTLYCFPLPSPWGQVGVPGDLSTLVCSDKPSGDYTGDGSTRASAILPYTPADTENINRLVRSRRDEALRFFPVSEEYRKRDLLDWIRNNAPDGDIMDGYNQNPTKTFLMPMAYLGDFTGTDYHPNDGNYVGEACGQNGAPLKKKKTSFFDNPSLWLANLAQTWSNLNWPK